MHINRPSVAAIDPARPTNGGWRRKNKAFKVPIPDPELFTLAVSHKSGYPDKMILSFRDKRTKHFAEGKRVKAFGGFEMQAHKRLRLLHLARHLQALRALPGIGWRRSAAIAPADTASASTNSGGFASNGRTVLPVRRMLRL